MTETVFSAEIEEIHVQAEIAELESRKAEGKNLMPGHKVAALKQYLGQHYDVMSAGAVRFVCQQVERWQGSP